MYILFRIDREKIEEEASRQTIQVTVLVIPLLTMRVAWLVAIRKSGVKYAEKGYANTVKLQAGQGGAGNVEESIQSGSA